MAYHMRFYLLLCGLLTVLVCQGFGKKTFISQRSQSVDAALGLVGWQPFIYRCATDNYLLFSITPTYIHSLHKNRITEYLFGCEPLSFTGSRVPNRQSTDILADYFGLPSDYQSLVVFSPHIINFMMRFDWFYGLDCIWPGLFTRFILPIVHAKWDLYLHECIVSTGTNSHPAGYMASTALARSQLAPSVEIALEGKTTFGDMQEPLQFGKIFGRENRTRPSELVWDLGYLFAAEDYYHGGIMMRVAAPIGNRATPEFLFQPTIGNGHHWELGVGLTGHIDFIADECQRLGVWSELYVTHLFNAHLDRSFDLNRGPGSRYMLLEAFASPAQNLNTAIGTPASAQYQGRLVPAINFTTLQAKIGIPVQIDWVVKGSYRYKTWEIDIGYDLWFKSAERMCIKECFPTRFALKGDAQVYGFDAVDNPVALSAIESQATIFAGQGVTNFSTHATSFDNLNVDTPVIALTGANAALFQLNTTDSANEGIAQLPVRTSSTLTMLSINDINQDSGLQAQALSHKFFAHISYIPDGYSESLIKPYLGGGGSVEFANTDPCKNSALSLWSIWAKGGLTFN